MATVTEFVYAITNGTTAVIQVVQDVGGLFVEPPFVLVPICAVIVLGYKLSGKVFSWVKGKWG